MDAKEADRHILLDDVDLVFGFGIRRNDTLTLYDPANGTLDTVALAIPSGSRPYDVSFARLPDGNANGEWAETGSPSFGAANSRTELSLV